MKYLHCHPFSWLPPSAASYIYTVLLRPPPLRRLAQSAIKQLIPATMDFRGSVIALNQQDAIVSGSLTLGCYEKFVTEILESLVRPGMTFIDIGANIGIYTALAARRVGTNGRVVAVEPGPLNVNLIRETIRLNGFENVSVFAGAAGAENASATLYLCDDNPADHRVHNSGGAREKLVVPTTTIDALARTHGIARADVIKIDTQGSEASVFAGMAALLAATPPPTVVFEFWPWGLTHAGSDPRALLDQLVASGFLLFEIDGDRRALTPRADLDALTALNLERQHINLLLCRDPQVVYDLRTACGCRADD
jgi:FkbM family methyltransferase